MIKAYKLHSHKSLICHQNCEMFRSVIKKWKVLCSVRCVTMTLLGINLPLVTCYSHRPLTNHTLEYFRIRLDKVN